MTVIKTFREFLFEKAVPIEELLADGAEIGLVRNEWNRNGTHNSIITLYDFDDQKILGYVEMDKSMSADHYKIGRTAAENNYGPDLYDFALMSVYPLSIRPSWVIKPAAQHVWSYYAEKRSDVKMSVIDSKDSDYVDHYGPDDEHDRDGKDPSMLRLINTKFSLEPTAGFKKLLAAGTALSKKYNVEGKKLFNSKSMKDSYFKDKYAHSTNSLAA